MPRCGVYIDGLNADSTCIVALLGNRSSCQKTTVSKASSSLRCDLHDYVEIACIFAYNIQLQLKNGESKQGVAVTTAHNIHGDECIKLAVAAEGNDSDYALIPLNDLASLTVLTKNARFSEVQFAS